MKRILSVAIATLAFFVAGCTSTATFNSAYEARDQYPRKEVSGQVVVITSESDDSFILSQSPSSFTGGATTLNIHIGQIIKQTAISVFDGVFTEGADAARHGEELGIYTVAIEPRYSSVDYQYNQLENAGFAITPKARVQLLVKATTSSGEALIDRAYDSGEISGGTYFMSGSPSEKANEVIHKAVGKALAEVARDLQDVLPPSS